MAAATVLSLIALTQFDLTRVWGAISERMDICHYSLVMSMVQSVGLTLVLARSLVAPVNVGFLLYAIGLSGHDATGSYRSSFLNFVIALIVSAFLSLAVREPGKNSLIVS